MKNFFSIGQIVLIIALVIIGITALIGAIIMGAWHLYAIAIMIAVLIASLFRDNLKSKSI